MNATPALNQFRLVFIGAPQAGKTSLMCAWYHFLKDVYDLSEVDEDDVDTITFLHEYERLLEGKAVDPTARGDSTHATFRCAYGNHRFDLALCDYSGEDVLSHLDQTLYGKNSDPNDPVASDIKNADWIFLVHDPTKIAQGTTQDQHDALWIGKVFPKLGEFVRDDILRRTTIYLSRGDYVAEADFETARSIVTASLPESIRQDVRIVEGASVLQNEDGSFRLPGDGEAAETRSLFNDVMTSLISRGRTRGKRFPFETAGLLLVLLVGGGALLVSMWPTLFPPTGDVAEESPGWQDHRDELDDIFEVAEDSPKFERAQQLLQEIEAWVAKAENDFPVEYMPNTDLQDEIAKTKEQLEAIKKPRDTNEVRQAVARLHDQHKSNRRAFYEELNELAAEEKSNRDYTPDARTEWSELESYSKRILGGVKLKLGSTYLITDSWWTTGLGAASNDMQLEIWIVPADDPKPFSNKTRHVTPESPTASGSQQRASLSTHFLRPSKSGRDQFIYRWPEGWQGQSVFKPNDRIWVRFFEFNYSNETFAQLRIPDRGPDGLEWFGQQQPIQALNRKKYDCRIRLEPAEPLETPESLRQAFR